LDCRPIQKLSAGLLYQKRFHFAAQFGIRLRQQRRAPLSCAFSSCVVQIFDLQETFRTDVWHFYGFGIVWLNARSSQALAKSQSRRAVRGEIFRAAAISSSVNPPK